MLSHLHNLNVAILRREVQWQPMVSSGCLELPEINECSGGNKDDNLGPLGL